MANQSIKDALQRFWEYVTAKIESQKTVVVTVTKSGDTYNADRTYAELVAHLDAGGKCEAVYVDGNITYVMPLSKRYSGLLSFSNAEYMSGVSQATVFIYESGSVSFQSTIVALLNKNGKLLDAQNPMTLETFSAEVTSNSGAKYIAKAYKIGKIVFLHLVVKPNGNNPDEDEKIVLDGFPTFSDPYTINYNFPLTGVVNPGFDCAGYLSMEQTTEYLGFTCQANSNFHTSFFYYAQGFYITN